MQKAAAKVLKTQAVEIYRCASNGLRGKEADPLGCATADSRGKLQKALDFARAYFDKKCIEIPDFGIASVDEIGAAGQQAPLLLLEDVLGASPSSVLVEDDRVTASCKRSILKSYDKLLQTSYKVFGQSQKALLRAGVATDGPGLIDGGLAGVTDDLRGLRSKFTTLLAATITKKCPSLDLGAAFPGTCSGEAEAGSLATCIAERADCRVCQAVNAVGSTSANCDLFDDDEANLSCSNQLQPCGNGILETGEECDEGEDNSDTEPGACRSDCRLPRCGDAVIDTGEACDNGPANSDYGDGTCRSDCETAFCGDGILDHNEECDDGGTLDSDFCSNTCLRQDWSAPLLVLLLDFSDTDVNSQLTDAEIRWADLMFGVNQAEANHYWSEIFAGRFDLQPVEETYGTANNGVVVAQVSSAAPSGTNRYLVEAQDWVPEALDQAALHVDFDAYDTDANGILENHELSVLVVLNMSWSNLSGSGAQANINLSHPIDGTGVELRRFARSLHLYGSIGVNVHELGHHVFDLDHFAPPGDHGVMSTGAYGEDPAISVLFGTLGNWGTRPTHPIAFSRMRAGFESPELPEWSGDSSTLTLHSIDTGNYNFIRLPLPDGYLLLENRRSLGYDQSIPFCDGDLGGIFITEVAQYIAPLDSANIAPKRESASYSQDFDICNTYSLSGKNDAFSYGGYDFSNFSPGGPTMTVELTRTNASRSIASYKWRWFKQDPEREGYRLWHHEQALASQPTVIDFAEVSLGDDATRTFPIVLKAYFDTGEERSLNKPADWTVSGNYVFLTKSDVTGGTGTIGTDAIVAIRFDESASCEGNATLTAEFDGEFFEAELTNLPCHTPGPTPTPSPTATPGASATPTPTPTSTPPPTPTLTPGPTPASDCTEDPAPEWVEHGDGTATQCSSGLRWELKTSGEGVHGWLERFAWSTGDPWTLDGSVATDFLDVLNDVAGSGANCLAGLCDWRLPSIEELAGQSSLGAASGGLVDPSAGTCSGSSAGCTTIPGETLPGPYLSSSTSGSSSFVYVVNFSSGNVQNFSKLNLAYARAVRP